MLGQVSFERPVEDNSMNGKYAVFSGAGKVAVFDELESAKSYAKEVAKCWGHVQSLIVRIEGKLQTATIHGIVDENNAFTETGRQDRSCADLATVCYPEFKNGKWKGGWLASWGEKE